MSVAEAKDVEESQQHDNSTSILPYMLKPPSFITKGLKYNNEAQNKLFNNMCNFEAQTECRSGRRAASSYLDSDTNKDQNRLLNTTPLDCITDYIM